MNLQKVKEKIQNDLKKILTEHEKIQLDKKIIEIENYNLVDLIEKEINDHNITIQNFQEKIIKIDYSSNFRLKLLEEQLLNKKETLENNINNIRKELSIIQIKNIQLEKNIQQLTIEINQSHNKLSQYKEKNYILQKNNENNVIINEENTNDEIKEIITNIKNIEFEIKSEESKTNILLTKLDRDIKKTRNLEKISVENLKLRQKIFIAKEKITQSKENSIKYNVPKPNNKSLSLSFLSENSLHFKNRLSISDLKKNNLKLQKRLNKILN